MNKIIFLLISINLIICSHVCAQNTTSSPYSMFGIGIIETKDYGCLGGMGNTGIAIKSKHFLNQLNPASYSGIDSLSFIYDFSAMGKISQYFSNGSIEDAFSADIKKVAIGSRLFPWWATSLGVSPFSMMGYQIIQPSYVSGATVNGAPDPYSQYYTGSGDLNQFYWDNSIKLTKNLSIGLRAAFIFGTLNQDVAFVGNDFDQINSYTSSNFKNFYYSYGFQYSFKINGNYSGIVGGVFGNKQSLNFSTNLLVQDIKVPDTIYNQNQATGTLTIPVFYGLGLSICRNHEITLAMDFKTQRWSTVTVNTNSENVFNGMSNLVNSNSISLGCEYAPEKRIPKNYFEIMKYRFGLSYNNTYMKVNGIQINDISMTVGFEFANKQNGSAECRI